MRKSWMMVAALALLAGVGAEMAGAGCCQAGKASGGESPAVVCKKACDNLTSLTAEQKAKVDAIMAECQKGASAPECMEKCINALKETLTEEQMAQFQAGCAKMSGGKCPMMPGKKAEPAEKQ